MKNENKSKSELAKKEEELEIERNNIALERRKGKSYQIK